MASKFVFLEGKFSIKKHHLCNFLPFRGVGSRQNTQIFFFFEISDRKLTYTYEVLSSNLVFMATFSVFFENFPNPCGKGQSSPFLPVSYVFFAKIRWASTLSYQIHVKYRSLLQFFERYHNRFPKRALYHFFVCSKVVKSKISF